MLCEAHSTERCEEGGDVQHCPMKTSDNPQKAASNPVGGGRGALDQPHSTRDGKKQVYPVMLYHHFGLFNNIKHLTI